VKIIHLLRRLRRDHYILEIARMIGCSDRTRRRVLAGGAPTRREAGGEAQAGRAAAS
jgi:hypothetical protein